jgi:urea transport system substrate-binding protein
MKPTPTDTHCPSPAELRRLLVGELTAEESIRLRNHLLDCLACRQLWEQLKSPIVSAPTPPLLHPAGDTNPGQPARPPAHSAITWSSGVALEGPGSERAAAPPPLAWDDAQPTFTFLSPPHEADEIGSLGNYRITGLLGQGGMGFVFDAFDTHLQRRVALKVLKPELAANLSFRERFLQEARAAAALPDEHIITIYQVGLENDVPFLAMKFLHGESLEQRLQREGRLPAREVLRIGREIALGLSAAHERGLIHRDIKPANLWLETPPPDQAGTSGPRLSCEYLSRVKILDFGLARPIDNARRLTATGLIVGTPSYLAPEQARGLSLDARCDLFSLGVVLYRMVTGLLPFDGPDTLAQLTALAVADPRPIEEITPDVPPGLRSLIHQLLERDPADRPATARAVAEALRALEKDDTIPSATASREARPRRVVRRPRSGKRPALRRSWLLAGVVGLLLVGGLLLWSNFRPAQPDHAAPAAREPIKIGILFSLRGTMANTGGPSTDAALLAIDELNSQGGLLGRPIEPIVEDGESDYRKFAHLAEKLIVQDRVCAIFGCRTSTGRKAVRPVVEKHNNLLLYPMQFEGLEESPNIVYLGAAPNQQMLPAIDYMLGIQRKRRLFLIGSDYIFPHAANAIIRDEVRGKYPDVQIVGEKYIPFGSTEVGGAIQAILNTNPDLILNTINGDTNAAFFRAFRRANLRAESTPILSFSIGENDLRSLQEEGIGHYAAWSYFQGVDRPENAAFVRKFRERFGPQRVLSDPMETVYFGVNLWAQAVQAAGSVEPAAVRDALKGRWFDAPEGRVRIDPDTGYTWRVVRLGRIIDDGQFDILWSSETPRRPVPFPLGAEHRTPAAWEQFLDELHRGWGDRWEAPER